MKRCQWAVAGLVLLGLASMGSPAMAEEAKAEKAPGDMVDMYRTIGLASAAAFVTAVSIVGAGYAVGRIGSAALGAAAEKPELLTRSILFVALAEGLAVLGFAIAMMLLQKIG